MRYRISEIDSMDGHRFEEYCADLMEHNGFLHPEVTKTSGDYGIDILAWKDGKKYAVQCKRHKGQIGVKAVQEALSGAKYYNAAIPVVLTNSTFTRQAHEMAAKTDVELWDRTRLEQMMKAAEQSYEAESTALRERLQQGSAPIRVPYSNKGGKDGLIMTAFLLLPIPVSLIPLWLSGWNVISKIIISVLQAVFLSSVFFLPEMGRTALIIYWVSVIAVATAEKSRCKNT